jgi:ribonuclease H2 subunit A
MKKFNPEEIETDFEKDKIAIGIDEAGRGPAIGPMVYACCCFKEELEEQIKSYFKFNDSKKLTPEKREKMFEQIKQFPNIFQYDIINLPPQYLSEKMLLRNKINLNKISHDSAVQLINNAIAKNINITHIYVDTVGAPDKYKHYIESNIRNLHNMHKNNIVVTVEKKADAKYESVSAASIIAKVTRDAAIKKIDFPDKNLGSGYPSDCYTVNWLERNYDEVFGYPDFIRFSWATINNKFKEKKNEVEWENYVEKPDEDENIYKKRKKNKKKNDKESEKEREKESGKESEKESEKEINKQNDRNYQEFLKRNFYKKYEIETNVDL